MNKKSKADIDLQVKIIEAQQKRQRQCDHSFDDNNICEYCGISESEYEYTGDGTYQ